MSLEILQAIFIIISVLVTVLLLCICLICLLVFNELRSSQKRSKRISVKEDIEIEEILNNNQENKKRKENDKIRKKENAQIGNIRD